MYVDKFLFINKDDALLYSKYLFENIHLIEANHFSKLTKINPILTKKIKVLILFHPYFKKDIISFLTKLDNYFFFRHNKTTSKYIFYFKNHPAYKNFNLKRLNFKTLNLIEIPNKILYPDVDILFTYNSMFNLIYKKFDKTIFNYNDIDQFFNDSTFLGI